MSITHFTPDSFPQLQNPQIFRNAFKQVDLSSFYDVRCNWNRISIPECTSKVSGRFFSIKIHGGFRRIYISNSVEFVLIEYDLLLWVMRDPEIMMVRLGPFFAKKEGSAQFVPAFLQEKEYLSQMGIIVEDEHSKYWSCERHSKKLERCCVALLAALESELSR